MTAEEVAHACGPDAEHCSCVPHLRAEIELLWCRIDDLERAREFVRMKAAMHERAAVVVWLRRNPGVSRAPECVTAMTPLESADCIENGEHRREEK